MLSGRKQLKVLTTKNKLPIIQTQSSFPHITAAITINGSGKCFDPFIILANKKTLCNCNFDDLMIVSSKTGWMTKRLFLMYVIHLISQVQLYRFNLPRNLKHEPFLLIVDGHISRKCFLAAYLLNLFNIDLLILPPHSSHIMQPFDVSIASPLKIEFVKQLQMKNITIDINNISIEQIAKLTLTSIRETMIESFLTALRKVTII